MSFVSVLMNERGVVANSTHQGHDQDVVSVNVKINYRVKGTEMFWNDPAGRRRSRVMRLSQGVPGVEIPGPASP